MTSQPTLAAQSGYTRKLLLGAAAGCKRCPGIRPEKKAAHVGRPHAFMQPNRGKRTWSGTVDLDLGDVGSARCPPSSCAHKCTRFEQSNLATRTSYLLSGPVFSTGLSTRVVDNAAATENGVLLPAANAHRLTVQRYRVSTDGCQLLKK